MTPALKLIEKIVQWLLIVSLGSLALLYGGDWAYVKWKMTRPGGTAASGIMGSVKVEPYWAIPLKDGKTEFSLDPPTEQPCIHSIFPHAGLTPCWYLSRHRMVQEGERRGRGHEEGQESLQAASRMPARSVVAGSVPKV